MRKAFWILIAATAALIVLIALGWPVLPVLVVMILVDILAIEAMRRADMKSINNDLAHTIAARFDSLDKLCGGIASSVTASRNDILRALGKEVPVAQEPAQVEPVPDEAAQAEAVIEADEAEAKPEEPKPAQAPTAGFSVNYGQD